MIIVEAFREWAQLSVGPDAAEANDFASRWAMEAEWTGSEARKMRENNSGRAEQPPE